MFRGGDGVNFAGVVDQSGGGDLDGEGASVFGAARGRVSREDFAADEELQPGEFPVVETGGDAVAESELQGFNFGPAIHARGGGIPRAGASVEVLHGDGVVGVPDDDGEAEEFVGLRSSSRVRTMAVISMKEMTAPSMTFSSVR